MKPNRYIVVNLVNATLASVEHHSFLPRTSDQLLREPGVDLVENLEVGFIKRLKQTNLSDGVDVQLDITSLIVFWNLRSSPFGSVK